MPRHVYRVCRAIYARLDGSGAFRAGGRWNLPGRAVVYMSESVAVAVLENLVHISRLNFPKGYVVAGAMIPDDVEVLTQKEVETLAGTGFRSSQALGDYWAEKSLSAVLSVPSAVAPGSRNYLLNPTHPSFRRIVIERPVPFEFDPRLFGG